MLKLLKYELINTWRSFGYVFIAYLCGCALVSFLPYDLSQYLMIVLILGCTGIVFAVMINIALDYYRTMFKRPAYLTLTLPVSTHSIVLSKLIASLIWIMFSGFILLMGLFMIVFFVEMRANVMTDWASVFQLIRISLAGSAFEIVSALVLMFVSLISSILLIYACTTAVQTKLTRNHKTILAFGLYFITNISISWVRTMLLELAYNGNCNGLSTVWLNTAVTFGICILLYYFIVTIINRCIEIE